MHRTIFFPAFYVFVLRFGVYFVPGYNEINRYHHHKGNEKKTYTHTTTTPTFPTKSKIGLKKTNFFDVVVVAVALWCCD